MRDYAILRDDDNPVSNIIIRMVHILRLARGRKHDIVADARILIDDRIFDLAIGADPDRRLPAFPWVVNGSQRSEPLLPPQVGPVRPLARPTIAGQPPHRSGRPPMRP